MLRTTRSAVLRIADELLFPVRALFMGPQGYLGLTSLRNERMWQVARFARGRVLDIGCGPGNLFISTFIGKDSGVGIDVFPYEGVDTVVDDALHLPFPDEIFDTITLLAVGHHIPRHVRDAEFAEFARVLKPGGRLIMTEGEPMTQWLSHRWNPFFLGLIGKVDINRQRGGLKEGEEHFMPRRTILRLLNTPPLRYSFMKYFQWGLNRVYVAEKLSAS